MNVLIVTLSYPPLRDGTSRLIGNVANSLSSTGTPVMVLTRLTGTLQARERTNGIDVIRIPSSTSLLGKISFMIRASAVLAISIRRKHIGIIHAVGTTALASAVLGSAGTCPIIVTFPGLPEESVRSGDPQRLIKIRARGVLHFLSFFPRYATVPTRQALVPVVELCGKRIATRIRVVSNPIDLTRFSPSDRTRSGENFPEILVVGGLRSRKGVGTLIEALPLVLPWYPNLRVTLVGAGSFRSALGDLIQRLGLGPSIRWTGEVSDEELIDYYRDCDLVVVPSQAGGEAFGYVVAEAMCMKRPVIASATPGPSEIIKEANSGLLFPPGDSKELASLILSLADNESQRMKIGENGRRYAERHFDSTMVVARFESLYRMAMDGQSPSSQSQK